MLLHKAPHTFYGWIVNTFEVEKQWKHGGIDVRSVGFTVEKNIMNIAWEMLGCNLLSLTSLIHLLSLISHISTNLHLTVYRCFYYNNVISTPPSPVQGQTKLPRSAVSQAPYMPVNFLAWRSLSRAQCVFKRPYAQCYSHSGCSLGLPSVV